MVREISTDLDQSLCAAAKQAVKRIFAQTAAQSPDEAEAALVHNSRRVLAAGTLRANVSYIVERLRICTLAQILNAARQYMHGLIHPPLRGTAPTQRSVPTALRKSSAAPPRHCVNPAQRHQSAAPIQRSVLTALRQFSAAPIQRSVPTAQRADTHKQSCAVVKRQCSLCLAR